MADQSPIEVVYVKIEADVGDYWKTVDKTLDDTVKKVSSTKLPKVPAPIPDGNEQNKTKGWFSGLSNMANLVKGNFSKMAGEGDKVKGALGGLGKNLQGFLTTGKGLSAVTGSFSALSGTLAAMAGPIAIVVAGIAAIGLAVASVGKKANEALTPLKGMLSANTLSEQKWDMGAASQKAGGVDTAKKFEDYNTQFDVLLGGIDKAEKRISEYAVFGAKTPYNLPEIVQAGKLLQTMGGEALATGDNLTMVGDMAAATGKPFTELSMWVGRTYSAMQSGRPFGEAAARLQEMGVLSGESRNELEKLQKSGASSTEQWAKFTEIMSKYGGMMDKMSRTLGGLQSNYEDFQEQVALTGGTPIFEAEKKYLEDLILDVEGEKKGVFAEHGDSIHSMVNAIGEVKASFMGFANEWKVTFLENLPYEQTAKLLEAISMLVQYFNEARVEAGAMELPEKLALGITNIVDKLQSAVEWVAGILKYVKMAQTAFSGWGEALAPIGQAIKDFLGMIGKIALAVGKVVLSFTPLGIVVKQVEKVGEAIGKMFPDDGKEVDWARRVAESIVYVKGLVILLTHALKPAIAFMGELANAVGAAMKGDWVAVGQAVKSAFDMVEDGLFDIEGAVAAATSAVAIDLAEIEAAANDTGAALEEASKAYEPAKIEAGEIDTAAMDEATKYADQLQDLQAANAKANEKAKEDSLKRMGEMEKKAFEQSVKNQETYQENYAKLFSDLEENKAKTIEEAQRTAQERKKDYDKQTERTEEDHLDAMKKMQDDYLFNLADAVKSRDARAIVDLRRQNQQQTDEAIKQHDTDKSRSEQDFADNEAKTREATDRQIAGMEESARLRAAEMEKQFSEQQAQLWENLDKQKEAEAENAAERLKAQDEAQKEKLASMAESMAKEGKLTEEQARGILGTLNDTFGIGGDIDKMMADFVARRVEKDRIYGEIELKFTKDSGGTSAASSYMSPHYADPGTNYNTGGTTRPVRYAEDEQGGYGFATGGLMIARQPTLVEVGEGGQPEVFSASPISALSDLQSNGGGNVSGKIEIELSGSAPPGVGPNEIDAISGVILRALNEAKAINSRQNF